MRNNNVLLTACNKPCQRSPCISLPEVLPLVAEDDRGRDALSVNLWDHYSTYTKTDVMYATYYACTLLYFIIVDTKNSLINIVGHVQNTCTDCSLGTAFHADSVRISDSWLQHSDRFTWLYLSNLELQLH